jgi:hypothetical protein
VRGRGVTVHDMDVLSARRGSYVNSKEKAFPELNTPAVLPEVKE